MNCARKFEESTNCLQADQNRSFDFSKRKEPVATPRWRAGSKKKKKKQPSVEKISVRAPVFVGESAACRSRSSFQYRQRCAKF